jgi:protocatechuate 3,4-dioxygenase beta subunit
VLTSGCRAVAGARVDFWQADASGAYDDTGVRLRSHQFTDVSGHYWLQTILPGPYANRTRHIHVTVRARGQRTVTTMLYFPGVALNAHDPFFDRRLLVRLSLVKHRFQARFDFVLGR